MTIEDPPMLTASHIATALRATNVRSIRPSDWSFACARLGGFGYPMNSNSFGSRAFGGAILFASDRSSDLGRVDRKSSDLNSSAGKSTLKPE